VQFRFGLTNIILFAPQKIFINKAYIVVLSFYDLLKLSNPLGGTFTHRKEGFCDHRPYCVRTYGNDYIFFPALHKCIKMHRPYAFAKNPIYFYEIFLFI